MILVYITCKDEEQAKGMAKHLLDNKLIACANITPIKSLYFWEGEIKDDSEVVLIAKSEEDKFNEIQKEVMSIHTYEVPCIIKINTEANPAFTNWLKEQLK